MFVSWLADRWIGVFAGRDIFRERGWRCQIALIPRQDLTPEAERLLVGWQVDLQTRPLRLSFRSDADRIANRILYDARKRGRGVTATGAEFDYAKVGGPPRRWYGIEVCDAVTGKPFDRVVEANAAEGWLIRQAVGADGLLVLDGARLRTERIEADIIIRRTGALQ